MQPNTALGTVPLSMPGNLPCQLCPPVDLSAHPSNHHPHPASTHPQSLGPQAGLLGAEAGATTYVEFGAGKGYLSSMLADCSAARRLVMMDVRGFQKKADRWGGWSWGE